LSLVAIIGLPAPGPRERKGEHDYYDHYYKHLWDYFHTMKGQEKLYSLIENSVRAGQLGCHFQELQMLAVDLDH
jgi:hypothetical protein